MDTNIRTKNTIPIYTPWSEAKSIMSETQRSIIIKEQEVENIRLKTSVALERLGNVKCKIYDTSMRDFIQAVSQIRGINFKDKRDTGEPNYIFREDFTPDRSKGTSMDKVDVLIKMIGAGGAGAVTGAITWGAVGSLALSSTGTAISTLSGVAATDATLAWLGGGSLAASGGGVVAGVAVLGGIIAVPIVIMGGYLINDYAKKKYEQAKSDHEKAQIYISDLDKVVEKLLVIKVRASDLEILLFKIHELLADRVKDIEYLTRKKADGNWWSCCIEKVKSFCYRSLMRLGVYIPSLRLVRKRIDVRNFNRREMFELGRTFEIADLLRRIIDLRLLSEDGNVTEESTAVLIEGNRLVAR
jgi:hypothetical protein